MKEKAIRSNSSELEEELSNLALTYRDIDNLEDNIIARFADMDERVESVLKELVKAQSNAFDILKAPADRIHGKADLVEEGVKRVKEYKEYFEKELQDFIETSERQIHELLLKITEQLGKAEEKLKDFAQKEEEVAQDDNGDDEGLPVGDEDDDDEDDDDEDDEEMEKPGFFRRIATKIRGWFGS